jgi:hypothetical protein
MKKQIRLDVEDLDRLLKGTKFHSQVTALRYALRDE